MENNTDLCLKGLQVDRIVKVGKPAFNGFDPQNTITQWEQLLFKRSTQGFRPYLTGGTLKIAFLTTMMGGYLDGFNTTEQQRIEFVDFLETGMPNQCAKSALEMMDNMTFFITEQGYIGLGPADTMPGDNVWIIYGCNVPVVLKGSYDGEQARCFRGTFRGESYTYGIMNGEMMKENTEEPCDVFLS